MITFGAWAIREERDKPAPFSVWLVTLAVLLSLPALAQRLVRNDQLPRMKQFKDVIQLTADSTQPILAEDPALPLLAGQRPFILDPWNVKLVRDWDPALAAPLWERLQNQSFSAVVLMWDPHSKQGKLWYESMHFGPGFIEQLERYYYLAKREREQFVYLPRGH